MITTSTPGTWQELQKAAGRILSECGFSVEIEKVVELARGKAEIDVHAVETVEGRIYKVLGECKHWKTAVPQAVVHGFRTVVIDSGAHIGYIISMKGYQDGAEKAAQFSNVELVTWVEFQERFEATWLKNFFVPAITERLDPLMTFVAPIPPSWFSSLPEDDLRAFGELVKEHFALGVLAMSMSRYTRILEYEDRPLPALPLANSLPQDELLARLPAAVTSAMGYREFFEAMCTIGEAAIADFRAIRDKNGFTGGE